MGIREVGISGGMATSVAHTQANSLPPHPLSHQGKEKGPRRRTNLKGMFGDVDVVRI